ncbi:hypothetical protein ACKKBG_A03770 [Auxenochlorella protothecoides x Auxenochlorella symbiontica]
MTRWMGDVSSRLVDERKMEILQLPLSQHFTNTRLEQAYRQYIGTIQLGNDVAMTRLMMVRRVGVGRQRRESRGRVGGVTASSCGTLSGVSRRGNLQDAEGGS